MRKKKPEEPAPLPDDPLWYKDGVIYQLHVRAYQDSNADGIGDFRGLIQRLDYLQDLGVTAVWLLPFYPSPLKDDGYDIADYTSVNPRYGTLPDFKLFLREAHRRGLRVITELVLNHTSDQHPWFQRARKAPAGSPERDFYVWNDTPDRYREARIIFKDFEPSNWTWDPVAKSYFWHRFYAHQPDLNYENPVVRRAMFELLDFWLDMGIDGLRLDAVPYLYEREGTNCENLPETHAYLKELRRHIDQNHKNRMLLAEANQWPEDAVAYFGQGDECHMAFHFPVMPRLFMATRMEDRFPVIDILQQTPAIPESNQWAMFLRNHDELTLEMVTDEDRDYMYRVYATDPQARINLGIRRRLAPLLENHRGKIELMNGLLFSLPGTPVIYYGDEIGMGDNIYLGDRNGVRTPMQWNAERNAGFSQANPQKLYLPAIIDPGYHFETLNVEAQQNNPHSLLWWMKRLIALRKRIRAFGRGTLEFLYPENHRVLAFVRRHEGERVLVVANLSRFVQYVELDLSAHEGLVPTELFGRTHFPPIGELPYLLTLGPYAFYWFSLEPQRVSLSPAAPQGEAAVLAVNGAWEDVFSGDARQRLEEALPRYLKSRPWFRGQERQAEAAMILETIPLTYDSSTAQVALVQVEYTEGEPETYVVPLGFVKGEQGKQLQETQPHRVVARLELKTAGSNGQAKVEGVLCDLVGDNGFAKALLQAFARKRHFKKTGGELMAEPTRAFRAFKGAGLPDGDGAVLNERANTLLFYDDRLVLKLFRRVEDGVNPELEVGRFLTERNFAQVPPLAGTLEYRRGWGEPLTLGILEGYVPNEGDAWHYFLHAVSPFYERALAEQGHVGELAFPARPVLELARTDPPPLAQELISLEQVRLLGRRTAEMHVTLASAADDPSFTPEPFTTLYQRSLYQSMRTQSRRALEVLRKRKELPEPVREAAQKLAGLEEVLLQRIRSVFERKITAQRLRCHGDYHLSQVLYTGKDFAILDFEGISSRSFSERRRKHSPLRDVACMIRSFHYVTHVGLRKGRVRPEDVPALLPWCRFWFQWVAAAFLKSYLDVAGAAGFLPQDPAELGTLLDFYLLKRAVFELRAELTGAGDTLAVPLRALLHLLEQGR